MLTELSTFWFAALAEVSESVGELMVFQSPFRSRHHRRRGLGQEPLDHNPFGHDIKYPSAKVEITVKCIWFDLCFACEPKTVKRCPFQDL